MVTTGISTYSVEVEKTIKVIIQEVSHDHNQEAGRDC